MPLLLLVLLINGCQQNANGDKHALKPINNKKKIAPQPIISKQDTIINFPCAVIIYPNEIAIARLKKTNAEETYSTIVDDNIYYMDQAEAFLDSIKLKKIEKSSHGSVLFKTLAGKEYEVKLDTLNWAVLLFNGKDKPVNADVTDIDADYKKYIGQ